MASETDGLTGEALREETTCSCGAGHGSGETHTRWCAYLTDSPAPIATPEEVAAREAVARWMIAHSFATGHGDALDDLLGELSAAITAERSALSTLKEENERLTALSKKRGRALRYYGMAHMWEPGPNGEPPLAVKDAGRRARAALSTEPTKET